MGPPLTVPALLARNTVVHGGRRAVVADGRSVTHAELDAESSRVAARLRLDGVGPGTRVGLLAENGVDWVVVAVAVMRAGAVLVPLSTLLQVPELVAQLEVAEVDVVVATRRFGDRGLLGDAGTAARAVPSVRAVRPLDEVVGPTDGGDVAGTTVVGARSAEPPRSAVAEPDDAVVLFTSGSRGRPKGVIHTHGGAVRAVRAGLEARRVGPDDRMYLPMPLFWTGGFSVGLFTMLVTGCTLLTEARPEPEQTLELLERERATLFRGWPDQAARLAAHPARDRVDLSSLRPASLPQLLPPDRRPPPGARPNVLGMTETFGPYCAERLDRDLPRELWGCCGRPFPGVELRVVDPGTGTDRPVGEQGELWLRGPTLLRGICGRDSAEVFTADGWFRTGDLGHVGPGGHVWYAGRLDDMFKVSGASVYPSEVEAALRDVPGVAEAHVTDVASPDGPRVGALVVGELTRDELEAEVRRRLSRFKVPTRWMVTGDRDAVPRGPTGKVDPARLRAVLGRHPGGG